MGYKEEFGPDFDLGFSLDMFPVALKDRSYGNDICPSFYFQVGEQYFLLWVDHQDKVQRENPEGFRYTITGAVNEGDSEYPEIYVDADRADLFSSESADALTQFLMGMLPGISSDVVH